jgi:CubicO group peptidase (beta-lactamase class C family)
LPRTTPESQGLRSSAISAFLDAIDAAPAIELHSLMILRHGQVLAEGWWQPYSRDEVHLLYSLSKSFTSAAAGLAAAEGLLSLDDKIVDLFSEHADVVTDDRVRRLTLRHLLRMATGHREDALPRAYQIDPKDLVRGFLAVPPDEEPGSIFCYNNAATFVVGAAVQKVSGQSLVEFLTPRLFRPLGIDRVYWQADPLGRNLGFSGLHLTTESIARFGQCIIQGGRFEDQQVLDPEWLDAATQLQTDNSSEGNPDWRQGYGYQFWMARYGFRGDGAYGQFCLVLPELDVIIAMTSATNDLQGILDRVWEHLLPGFSQLPVPADPAAHDALAQRLAELSLTPVGAADWRPAPIPKPELLSPGVANPVRVAGVEEVGDDELVITLDHDQPRIGSPRISPADPADRSSFRCGIGHWITDSIDLGGGRLVYAGSGTRGEGNTLDVELSFIQTPHRLRLRQHADGRTESGWLTEPLGVPFPEELATAVQDLSGS